MRVAFLGLGIMGHAMATNLAKAGHEVTVWNRTAGKQVEGARTATTPAEAAQGAEVVWLCVSDTDAVDSVLLMLLTERPNALAFSQSMSILYCGSSFCPFARTARRTLLFPARSRS